MISKKPRTVAVVQARMGSTRLPGKSMLKLGGLHIIDLVIGRTARSKTIDEVILATSTKAENDVLADRARSLGIESYRGSESDVLSRIHEAATRHNAETIVRVCADNPLIAPSEVDRIVDHHHHIEPDYSFNHVPKLGNGYPDGLGAEVVDLSIVDQIAATTDKAVHREHVTKYIWHNPTDFMIETVNAPAPIADSNIKLDIDTPTDQRRLEKLFEHAPSDPLNWGAASIVATYRKHVADTDNSKQ